MERKGKVEIWSARFGGRRSFADEISSASEIGAEWSGDAFQSNVILDHIPGWLEPLWGVDGNWLYARRPEGVWKTAIPRGRADGVPTFLCHRLAGDIVGMLSMGTSLKARSGWVRGHSVAHPMDAIDRDAAARPKPGIDSVDADLIGSAWGALVDARAGRLVVDGGEHFDRAPRFEMEGDWLVATDPCNRRRVAYPLTGYRAYRRAIDEGSLWLLLGGKWTRPIEVRVVLAR